MLQTKVLPSSVPDGVNFRALIKSNITLRNGKETVMFTFVPDDLSFDDAMAGVLRGVKLSERAKSIYHEVFTLESAGVIIPFAKSTKRDLSIIENVPNEI